MADRRVRKTGKNDDGDITFLCNSGETWSPRSKASVVSDIEDNTHTYYVNEDGTRTNVRVVEVSGKKHLRTTLDKTNKNNLDNLPDC